MKKMKADFYNMGDGAILLNIRTMRDGAPDRIDTYIGKPYVCSNGLRYEQVASVEELAKPGVTFSYAEYMRTIEANVDVLADIYEGNVSRRGPDAYPENPT